MTVGFAFIDILSMYRHFGYAHEIADKSYSQLTDSRQ